MSKKTKDSFYSLWTLAILLCLALSVFALLFASCSKGGTAETATETETETETEAEPLIIDGTAVTLTGDAAGDDTATETETTDDTAGDSEDAETGTTDEEAEEAETESETGDKTAD